MDSGRLPSELFRSFQILRTVRSTVFGGYAYIVQLAPTLGGLWQMLMGTALVPLENVWPTILTYSLVAGALVGGLGSMFSIRKHLNV